MSSEIIVNASPHETRVALITNGIVVELHIERKIGQELLGNIYRGKVVRVLPGMQAAFVDIGHDRTAFLYVSDVYNDFLDLEKIMVGNNEFPESPDLLSPKVIHPNATNGITFQIEDMLREGQNIMVQVSKEPINNKGARITSHISLPGRNLVLMPTVNHIGISRRIEDNNEKERLKEIIQEIRPVDMGFIVRTVSEGAIKEELIPEMKSLLELWAKIQAKMEKGSRPCLLHSDLPISLRCVRDLYSKEVDRLIIDSRQEYRNIMEFIRDFAPRLKYSIEHYDGPEPIFEAYGIETELSTALDSKIWLKSGGYIVIEPTEALTAIDVNTGSYVGKRDIEETILKTNLEAVKEIAYQLRFRNIGGLIVIDFIDMAKKPNRERVFMTLKEAVNKDPAKTNVLPMSDLGLIEMTRKRTRASLNRQLTKPCFYCEGTGRIKSKRTIFCEVYRTLERECSVAENEGEVYILINPEIDNFIREEEADSIRDLEKRLGRHIVFIPKQDYHMEQYEVSVQSAK